MTVTRPQIGPVHISRIWPVDRPHEAIVSSVRNSLSMELIGQTCGHVQSACVMPNATKECNGSGPLNSTRRHGHFLNSTCDIGP